MLDTLLKSMPKSKKFAYRKTDIRDDYQGSETGWVYANSDTVVIPSGGTDYVVVFVEVRGKGTAGEHKRVYLDRQLPGWPAV